MGFVILGAVLAYAAAGTALWLGAGWLWAGMILMSVGTASALACAAFFGTAAKKAVDQYSGDPVRNRARHNAN